MVVNSFYTVERRLIAWYCAGTWKSLVEFFGIGLMVPVHYGLGITPYSKIYLYTLAKRLTEILFLDILYGRLSGPIDFPDLEQFTAHYTSPISIGLCIPV